MEGLAYPTTLSKIATFRAGAHGQTWQIWSQPLLLTDLLTKVCSSHMNGHQLSQQSIVKHIQYAQHQQGMLQHPVTSQLALFIVHTACERVDGDCFAQISSCFIMHSAAFLQARQVALAHSELDSSMMGLNGVRKHLSKSCLPSSCHITSTHGAIPKPYSKLFGAVYTKAGQAAPPSKLQECPSAHLIVIYTV